MTAVGAGSPLVFIHIPKTAGTALRMALSEAIDAQRPHVCFDPTHLGGFDPAIITYPPMRARLKTRPEDYPADADLVVGHVAPSLTRVRFPDAPHMTVLREGRSRIVSMWLYSRRFSDRQLRRWGAGAALFQSSRKPLADYLTSRVSAGFTDNVMLRQLVWPHPLIPADDFINPAHDAELLEAALQVLRSFEFVGVVEDRELAAKLGAWLGRPIVLDHREHEGVITADRRPDVVAECQEGADLLTQRSRLDQALWHAMADQIFPDDDPTALAEQVFSRTVQRHAKSMATAPSKPVKIRVADLFWDVTHRARRQH